jgi:hypothetical protein
MGDLGRQAAAQVERVHAKRRSEIRDPLAAVERGARKHVKGIRGDVDLDELADLLPSLKKTMQAERSERAKRVRELEAEMRSVTARATTSTIGHGKGAAGGKGGGAGSGAAGSSAAASAAGLRALLSTADDDGGGDGGGGGGTAAAAPRAGGKRARPEGGFQRVGADVMRRAIDGARAEGGEADGDEDGGEGGGEGAGAAARGRPAKRARVETHATRRAGGKGSGSRFGVNDTREGSGAELQPAFGGGGGAGGGALAGLEEL